MPACTSFCHTYPAYSFHFSLRFCKIGSVCKIFNSLPHSGKRTIYVKYQLLTFVAGMMGPELALYADQTLMDGHKLTIQSLNSVRFPAVGGLSAPPGSTVVKKRKLKKPGVKLSDEQLQQPIRCRQCSGVQTAVAIGIQ